MASELVRPARPDDAGKPRVRERYSALSLLRHALGGHRGWTPAWRDKAPKPAYDVVIIGGGGHGLATAYYLAREHGITNVAVLEKGWLGGGGTGRNTTIVRSNFMLEPNTYFTEWSMKLWENLSQELNFNMMFSQRGVLNLAHTEGQLDAFARRGNAMRLGGVDAELLSREEVARRVPSLDVSPQARFPVMGGLLQPRAGVARHDAVAWGYARAADALGVDIIQNCEVTGIHRDGGAVTGVDTTRGPITAGKVAIAVAGHTTQLADMAGIRTPIESHVLQAVVSEPLKPTLDMVVTSGATHLYCSQTDKGELVFGGDLEGYNSFAARGNLPTIQSLAGALTAMFPRASRLRMLRHWGGTVDMSMDGSPIIAKTPVDGLYLNGGWCYGGFKATPASGWTFAHTIARDEPHPLNAPFTLERFHTGRVVDEKGMGPRPGAH
ncbi:sarcosine oxidase subunit beta [Limimonas halophila]|uniref:Sarcosine oxidase subunit beta n=1 Tax=Limimonas halophila TaxID=1082479 RepID=A0A1G7L487_9PROT|nr:sarcosine oxidase subunit beta family protein [Limimonas halophila]SDF43860.1 sarcosine oxidase subunit beta [Limimonas halophila]